MGRNIKEAKPAAEGRSHIIHRSVVNSYNP